MEVVAYVKTVRRDLEVTNRFVTVVLHNHVVQMVSHAMLRTRCTN